MADLFVRRTTAALLVLVSLLCVAVVALLVLVLTAPPADSSPPPPAERFIPERFELIPEEEAKTEPWEVEYRIPTSTLPLHYDIYLHPDLDAGRFSGTVAILVAVTSPMSFLVAHFKDLNITQTKLRSLQTDSMVDLQDYFEYKPNQFWVLRPKKELQNGNYSIKLHFEGSLENRIVGFYKSVYTNAAGQKRSIATSKFQPTDARGAFPCFDEPSFKSTFSVTLVRPTKGYIALSNMPQQSERPDTPHVGLTEVYFQKSVPMVTYLACFIVCDFEHVETETQNRKPFKVYATPEQVSRAQYSLDIGVNILNYFENYFKVPYPLPKQDMIAIPDFVSGAMEHWGLITYREVNLLYDEQGSSSYNKQRVATVVSHELAHMWFGNLVTLSWWDDLWLNEGFASYMEYKGVAHYEKNWDMLGQFVVQDLQPVFRLDAQLSSHPIIQPVAHPDQITEIFDSISYSKGASVLRMLDNFMGEENFRQGVQNFLKEYEYGNAVTSDLWRHLEQTAPDKLIISEIMDTWTKQMGYPVLDVKRTSPTTLEVRQKRFLQDPLAVSDGDSFFGYNWDVPVTFKTAQVDRKQHWLYRNMPVLSLTVPEGSTWVKLNVDQYGYYRVNYDQSMWDEIIVLLSTDHELLSPSDRSSLLDDAFSLAAADQLPYTVPLRLAAYLEMETHYIPWKTVVSHLSDLDLLLQTTKAYPLYRRFVLQLVRAHANKAGWMDAGDHLQRLLRPLLLSLACKSGDSNFLEAARERLQRWLRDPADALPPNLRTLVYTYGIKGAEFGDWEELLERYINEVNAQEKSKLLIGLTSTNTNWIMHRFLDVSRNESVVRSQDYLTGLIYAARNPETTHIVWEFVKSEWTFLVSRYSISNRYLGRMVKSVVELFSTDLEIKDAEQFFASEPEAGSGARARQQALEEARKRVGWINRHSDQFHSWLQENVQ